MSNEIDEKPPEEAEAEADPNNAGNPIAIKAKAKTAKQRDRNRVDVVGALLEQPAGRDFLSWLLFDACGLYSIAENAAFDTNALHYREGGRAIGLALHRLALRANAKQYMDMLSEQAEQM